MLGVVSPRTGCIGAGHGEGGACLCARVVLSERDGGAEPAGASPLTWHVMIGPVSTELDLLEACKKQRQQVSTPLHQ